MSNGSPVAMSLTRSVMAGTASQLACVESCAASQAASRWNTTTGLSSLSTTGWSLAQSGLRIVKSPRSRGALGVAQKRRFGREAAICFAWKAQRFKARDTGGHDAWLDLKALHLAVVILLPIGSSPFQQLQPRHASDYAIGVNDRIDERSDGSATPFSRRDTVAVLAPARSATSRCVAPARSRAEPEREGEGSCGVRLRGGSKTRIAF
jgi:hypothetical protein